MGASALVAFNGGIAVDPESGTTVVCGVEPGGAPWTIGALQAVVQADGRIRAKGSGLLRAGTNVITSNSGQVVRAQLFCNNAFAGCGSGSSTVRPG